VERTDKHAPYLLFVLTLSIFALILLTAEVLLPLDEGTSKILNYADTTICLLFFLDFLITVYRSENRLRYFVTWGWLDLLSCVPMIDALRVTRAARIVRIVRVLRALRSARILATFILQRRAQSGLMAASLVFIVVVFLGSVAILHFERGEEKSNIHEPEDAVWWSVVTLSTVGSGDKYPVTPEGRLIGVVLTVIGVALIGTLSGFVAAWFLAPGEQKQESELEALRIEIKELRQLLQGTRAYHEAPRVDG
jgi:voltage-gated potassium channel